MTGKHRPLFNSDPGKSYLLFNKPFEVMSQFSRPDSGDKSTLADFGFPPDVYPVGRLDYDSEGIIVLTDDPRLNKLLLDPINRHDRTYLAQVERVPSGEKLEQLRGGVIIDQQRTLPARAELLPGEPEIPARSKPVRFRKNIPTSWVKLVLQEGKNHQVRRMTASVGHPTLRLVRIEIGRLNLFSLALQPGDWIRLNKDQISLLFARADDNLRIPLRNL